MTISTSLSQYAEPICTAADLTLDEAIALAHDGGTTTIASALHAGYTISDGEATR